MTFAEIAISAQDAQRNRVKRFIKIISESDLSADQCAFVFKTLEEVGLK